jgi:hypothetical protein
MQLLSREQITGHVDRFIEGYLSSGKNRLRPATRNRILFAVQSIQWRSQIDLAYRIADLVKVDTEWMSNPDHWYAFRPRVA